MKLRLDFDHFIAIQILREIKFWRIWNLKKLAISTHLEELIFDLLHFFEG